MKCKQCGKCCANLILEIPVDDKYLTYNIIKRATVLSGKMVLRFNSNCRPHACIFLNKNRCGIYINRPQLCRGFKPGKKNEQCFGYAKEPKK